MLDALMYRYRACQCLMYMTSTLIDISRRSFFYSPRYFEIERVRAALAWKVLRCTKKINNLTRTKNSNHKSVVGVFSPYHLCITHNLSSSGTKKITWHIPRGETLSPFCVNCVWFIFTCHKSDKYCQTNPFVPNRLHRSRGLSRFSLVLFDASAVARKRLSSPRSIA